MVDSNYNFNGLSILTYCTAVSVPVENYDPLHWYRDLQKVFEMSMHSPIIIDQHF